MSDSIVKAVNPMRKAAVPFKFRRIQWRNWIIRNNVSISRGQ